MSSSLKYKGSSKVTSKDSHEVDREDHKKEGILAAYQSMMHRYPLPMNAIQSSCIAGLGVCLSQLISHGAVIDTHEVRVMMIINVIYHTPILYTFYNFILTKFEHFGMLITLFVDQCIFSPLFTAGVIALRMYLKEGGSFDMISNEVITVVPNAMLSSWSFWIPIRFLIIKFIPKIFQQVSGSLAALIWNIIFSMILNKK